MRVILSNFFKFRIANHKLLSKRNKYIILLPEIPPDTAETNPLLRIDTLPAFSQLNAEKCVNAIGKLVIEYESGIHQLDQKLYDASFQRNVHNIILPLDRLSGPLDFAWGAFKILYTVSKDESIVKAYLKLHPGIIRAKREKFLSSSIYRAFKELKDNATQLTEPVQRIINKHLVESQLSGMDLTDSFYDQFREVMTKLDKHRALYKGKYLTSTAKFTHNLEFSDVQNFPDDILKLLVVDQSKVKTGPWVLTLEPYVYKKFLEYCDNRLLRWNAWYANNIRATSISGKELDNSIEIEEIRFNRRELARLLGFETFAHLSMKTKMAGSVDNVKAMITTLHVKSKDATLKEIDKLQSFANENGFNDKLQLWDIPYCQRLHKETLFNVDDAVIRHYFPFPYVLNGIFNLFNKLFRITVKEIKNVDVWHEDVSYYKIYNENDKEIASFFIDPYIRQKEKSMGSYMEVGSNRSDVTGVQPLSYLVFNFYPPAFGRPALLSFDDLKVLFEKFGHLLQHSLTTVPYADVSGLTNLEWDVVNVCPFVMKSFLKHYNTVANLSCHVDSGKVLPPELHENLIKRDMYMPGLKLTEELYLSTLDLELYSKKDFWLAITKKVWADFMPFPYEKNTSQPCSFPEVFSDHLPAAYFVNLWAKMIAADVFQAFEEAGLDDDEKLQEMGMKLRETYLALGGGSYPEQVFRKFRGRDPCVDALLESYKLADKNSR